MHLDFKVTYNLQLTPEEFRIVLASLALASATAPVRDGTQGAGDLYDKLVEQRRARALAWSGQVERPEAPS